MHRDLWGDRCRESRVVIDVQGQCVRAGCSQIVCESYCYRIGADLQDWIWTKSEILDSVIEERGSDKSCRRDYLWISNWAALWVGICGKNILFYSSNSDILGRQCCYACKNWRKIRKSSETWDTNECEVLGCILKSGSVASNFYYLRTQGRSTCDMDCPSRHLYIVCQWIQGNIGCCIHRLITYSQRWGPAGRPTDRKRSERKGLCLSHLVCESCCGLCDCVDGEFSIWAPTHTRQIKQIKISE